MGGPCEPEGAEVDVLIAPHICIEGEWHEVNAVIQQCYEELAKDSNRIVCTVKMDWRRGQVGRLTSKVDSVQKTLGRKLST